MICDITDIMCVWQNELIGSKLIFTLLLIAAFFVFASKQKLGYKTTLWLIPVVLPIIAFWILGTYAVLAILTLYVGILMALFWNKIWGNR